MLKKMASQSENQDKFTLSQPMFNDNKIRTSVKAIEAYCVEFCKDSPRDVRLCHSETCPLHPYRLGQLPVDGDNPRKNLKDIEQPDSGINGIPVDELIMIF